MRIEKDFLVIRFIISAFFLPSCHQQSCFPQPSCRHSQSLKLNIIYLFIIYLHGSSQGGGVIFEKKSTIQGGGWIVYFGE